MDVKPEVMGTPTYFEQLCRKHFPSHRPLTIIEVGTWKGASAFNMISACDRKCKVYCVDTWLGSLEHYDTIQRDSDGYPNVFKDFWKNVKDAGYEDIVVPVTLPSLCAAKYLASKGVQADVIYIDAAHEYEDVIADLRAYWKLLKSGGLMLGDDYHHTWEGVVRAANQFVREVECESAEMTCKTYMLVKK